MASVDALSRRLDRLTIAPAADLPLCRVEFMHPRRADGPIVRAVIGGETFTPEPGETEDEFIGRITQNPCRVVIVHRRTEANEAP
jgi:hypothetical protein